MVEKKMYQKIFKKKNKEERKEYNRRQLSIICWKEIETLKRLKKCKQLKQTEQELVDLINKDKKKIE